MRMSKKKFAIFTVMVFLAGFAVSEGLGLLLTRDYVRVSGEDYEEMAAVYESYGKLYEMQKSVENNFYKEFDQQSLIDGAAKGLMEGLGDPYSVYFTKEEYEAWEASVTGNYSGIGITFSADQDGNYVIVAVEKGSPADKAGLEPGDHILSANGKTYDTVDAIATAIRGKKGTEVTIEYERDGKKDSATMTRENITQHSVEHEMLDSDTGYIQITAFLESTGEDFIAALKEIEEKGAGELVLDLRNNGGGLVASCVTVADEFLDEGVVMYVEDQDKKRTEYNSEDGKTDLKTVVLVNENSASAAEILAAALQDNGVELVGKKTFGKGVIQGTFEMTDGSAMEITMMQYFSPNGNVIHEKGVTPDHEVDGEDAQLEKALSLL